MMAADAGTAQTKAVGLPPRSGVAGGSFAYRANGSASDPIEKLAPNGG